MSKTSATFKDLHSNFSIQSLNPESSLPCRPLLPWWHRHWRCPFFIHSHFVSVVQLDLSAAACSWLFRWILHTLLLLVAATVEHSFDSSLLPSASSTCSLLIEIQEAEHEDLSLLHLLQAVVVEAVLASDYNEALSNVGEIDAETGSNIRSPL